MYKTLMVLLFIVTTATAQANECKHRLIFIPQTHKLDSMVNATLDESSKRRVAESQLRIANFIDEYPDIPVFSEQVSTEDFILSSLDPAMRAQGEQMVQALFPAPLITDPAQLTSAQVDLLYKRGAGFIQMFRGKTQHIHRVFENQAENDLIVNQLKAWFATNPDLEKGYPPEIAKLTYEDRERALLRQVNKFFAANPQERDVLVIFGANHSFMFYDDLFPSDCLLIPKVFTSFWTGAHRKNSLGF